MLIEVKNKDTLIFDDFIFQCAVGKKGGSSKKKEGDLCTPRGVFSLKTGFYRSDRIPNLYPNKFSEGESKKFSA